MFGLELSSDGKTVVIGTTEYHEAVRALAFGGKEGIVTLWEPRTGRRIEDAGIFPVWRTKSMHGVNHHWIHCILHVGMFVTAVAIVSLLVRHARHMITRPPNWLKLLTPGYLGTYAVLLQVAFFPINFYIP